MKLFFAGLFFFLTAALPCLYARESKLPVGEKLTYEIRYLGVPVGEAVSEVKNIEEVRGRQAYRIEVRVHSYRTIDWFYKVRDEHRSFVDVQTLASLGYEKKIREGRRRAYEKMEIDLSRRKARYFDETGGLIQEQEISERAQDALSCGYFTRTLNLSENSSVFIPVHADKKNWNLEVRFFEQMEIAVPALGMQKALRAVPLMDFEGIFFRKGRIEGWLGLDTPRIPLKMSVRIPVLGWVGAQLVKYQAGGLGE